MINNLSKAFTFIAKELNSLPARKTRLFLFLSCFIFLIISAYPVIFFNKSFVSPAGVSQMSGPPGQIIPEFKNEDTGYLGDDRGAMLWGVGPAMSVAYKSLTQYKEFPFWNRYIAGGSPLYAQTSNLILDPTNVFFLYFGTNSWAYDLKFLLSRLIFSFGIAILILEFTQSIRCAFYVGVGSIFLGYYQTRFNHPAIFVLTYMPWLIIAWKKVTESFLNKVDSLSKVKNSFLLLLTSFLLLNSGPIKETVPAAFVMHFLGALIFTYNIYKAKSYKYGALIFSLLASSLILSSLFCCYLFMGLLHESFTVYDKPAVNQIPVYDLIAFFQLSFNKGLEGFSSNLFYLFCVSLFFTLRTQIKKTFLVNITLLLILFLFLPIYGFIPNDILVKIPYFNNIHHIQNVLGAPLFVLITILSGEMLKKFFELSASEKVSHFNKFILFFAFIYLFYASINRFNLFQPFIYALIFLSFVSFFLFFVKRYQHICFLGFFLGVCLINGQHLATGHSSIDKYLLIPASRADYSIKSTAVNFVEKFIIENGPTRVIGIDDTLFPGYNERLGLEGLVSAEPVRSHYVESFYDFIHFNYANDWHWLRILNKTNIDKVNQGLDVMNVGLVISELGEKLPSGFTLIHQSDYMVWRNENYWPRAFYTNNILYIKNDKDISKFFDRNFEKNFFAVLESKSNSKNYLVDSKNKSFSKSSAFNYQFTNNSTSFDIEIPSPGIVVLNETYYPKDFKLYVDGEIYEYFRVNQCFKGFYISKPGKHNVKYQYSPKHYHEAFYLTILGFIFPILFLLF